MSNIVMQAPELQQLLVGGFKLTPLTLAMRTSHGRYLPARHLQYVSAIIASEIAKGSARIIFQMPPRHGKSELCSHNVPVWFLDKYPTKRVVLCTYGAELSRYFGRRVRDTIEMCPDILGIRVRDDAKGVTDFLTEDDGGMLSAGVGGPITGRGYDLGLIDDYIKNAADSLSPTIRQSHWDWFLSTFYTRREPGASIIIFATRWNIDDLIGRCLKELAHENWLVIRLPAIAEVDDPLGREVGDPLWPERYALKDLTVTKQTLGNYWWKAMYQQNPIESMSDETRGDRIQIIDHEQLPHFSDLKAIRAWDFASSEEPSSVTESTSRDPDYTVGFKLAMSKTTGRFFIIDVDRFREGPYKTEIRVKNNASIDGLSIHIVLEQEPGASGKTFVENYSTKVLPGYHVLGIHPTGPLVFRASPFLASVEAGKVSMLRAPWNEDVKSELNQFPNGSHDDIVSAGSLAYNRLVLGIQGSVTWGNLTDGQLTQVMTQRMLNPHKRHQGIVTGVTW